MSHAVRLMTVAGATLLVTIATASFRAPSSQAPAQQPVGATSAASFDSVIAQNIQRMTEEGRRIFRFDTFGDEAFWGDQLRLHQAIVGQKLGGVGPGLSPKMALSLGLKVDAEALPEDLVAQIKAGKVDMNDPASTVALLKANAVVGVTAFLNADGTARSVGIQCALCHSTVDDSFAPGIGRRRDGWPNRDLNVGEIVALAPTLKPFSDLLGVDDAAVRKVLKSWGPGKYDAELVQDGKTTGPKGASAATVLPAAFGLAGVNLHTYSGWGGVSYWNAYVANTQMHGKGTFVDPRLNDKSRFPLAAKAGHGNLRNNPDLVTSKLAALHFYQLAIPAPTPPSGSFDAQSAQRGKTVFEGQARCATCHVPPLFTEPGWAMHKPDEIGIDTFQADRSPDRHYRTTPLRGLFTRQKGGFYHDGRFATLDDVVNHYDAHFKLKLNAEQKQQLVEYLKSL
jgi:cytochrome c5